MTRIKLVYLDPNAPQGSVPVADGQGGSGWITFGGGVLNIPIWLPNRFYLQNYVVQYQGVLYWRNTTGTSASTWSADQASWTAFAGSGSGLHSPLDGGTSAWAGSADGGTASTASGSYASTVDGGASGTSTWAP